MNARRWIAAGLFAVLAACSAVGPDYEAPAAAVPAEWREPDGPGYGAGQVDLAQWWRRFDDPVLDELVARSAHGLDVREALARLSESRALRGIAAADRYPTVDARAAFDERNESENTAFGGFPADFDQYAAGFDAAWELDLWGRVRRSVEAADADLAAILEDARDVAVTVTAETAARYVELRAFQRRIEIARTNVTLQEETLALVQARFEAGLVGERDVAQASTIVESTRSRVPAFEAGLRAAENRLAVLLGLTPGALAAELAEPRPIPVPPAAVSVGVPADLLRRRADVRRAERELAAETARIGVAEADLYPRLTLLGTIGVAASNAGELADDGSGVLGIGPSLRWNLFDGGARRREIDAQDARAEQARVRWERTVLVALEETENGMTAYAREQARRGSLLEAATQARRAVELAQTEYTEGLSDFSAVLDSQRALAVLEDELAGSDAAIATNLVVLYKALGGGWQDEPALAVLATQ